MEESTHEPCPPPGEPFVSIAEDGFGFVTNPDGNREIVRRYTFTNQNHLMIQVITYGATITSIKYPDQCGIIDDVALGFDDIKGYLSKQNPYMGAIIGRFANRIAKGHFKINGDDYQLSTNSGEHHIHGGFRGFDKVNWKSDVQGNKLVLTYMSKDGEEGYPGEVLVSVTYQMTTDNQLMLDIKATTSKPTPINLTNHTYFNLAGHAAGSKGLAEHLVCINADRYVSTDEDLIPTGCLINVTGTLWDLRIPRKIGQVIHLVPYGGYDQCMCIHKTDSECMTFNASDFSRSVVIINLPRNMEVVCDVGWETLINRVVHPNSGRTLEIYSNQPGVQFYTSNNLPKPAGMVAGDGDTEAEVQICPIRVCPICGYTIRDPDFEKPPDECCSEEKLKGAEDDSVKIVRLIGKDDADYYFHGAFCLMTEKFPDSVHRKNFPSTIVRPGEIYRHIVHYKFGLFEDVVLEPEDKELYIDEWRGEGEEMIGSEDKGDDLLETKLEENGR